MNTCRTLPLLLVAGSLALTSLATAQTSTTYNVRQSGGPDGIRTLLDPGGRVEADILNGVTDVTVLVEPGDYWTFSLSFGSVTPATIRVVADAPQYADPRDYCASPLVRIVPDGFSQRALVVQTGSNLELVVDGLTLEGWTPSDYVTYVAPVTVVPRNTPSGPDGSHPTFIRCGFQDNIATTSANSTAVFQAVEACDPKIIDCCFQDNIGHTLGGAIWIYSVLEIGGLGIDEQGDPALYNEPLIEGCWFCNNVTTNPGGGGGAIALTNSSGTIRDCKFYDNAAGHGAGAVYGRYTADVVIEDCHFERNGITTDPTALQHILYDGRTDIGGAIYMNRGSSHDAGTVVRRNTFLNNCATRAGAVCYVNANSFTLNNRFEGNQVLSSATLQSSASALGIRGFGGLPPTTDPGTTITNHFVLNNLFVKNRVMDPTGNPTDPDQCVARVFTEGGAVGHSLGCFMLNNTITQSSDRAVTVLEDAGSNVGLIAQNGIFWDNGSSFQNPVQTLAGLDIFSSAASGGMPSVQLTYSIIEQRLGIGGLSPTNLDLDPLFVGQSDFHLSAGSPALDSGNNFYWASIFPFYPQISSTDLDGNVRVQGTVDRGCYER